MKKTVRWIAWTMAAMLLLLAGCAPKTPGTGPSDGPESPDDPENTRLHKGYTLYRGDLTASNTRYQRTIPTEGAKEPTASDFTVSNYFRKNMVVPRDNEIVIWGTAPEDQNGKIVSAEFKGLSGSGTVENGRWQLSLNGTLPASAELGHTLKIWGTEKTVELEDVLVGDVWLIYGQSNAELTFAGTTQQSSGDLAKLYKEETKAASEEDPIRFLHMTPYTFAGNKKLAATGDEPQFDIPKTYKWYAADKRHVSSGNALTASSLLGYFFAKRMVTLNPEVPIGYVDAGWGGVPLSALSSAETEAKMAPEFRNRGCIANTTRMHNNAAFNTLIAPITKVPIKGMVFFQGEGDADFASRYDEALKIFVDDMRALFQSNFLMINMQLTTYGYESGGTPITSGPWAHVNELRYAQALPSVEQSISDYFLVTTFDCGFREGDGDGAHPYYKKPISERGADVAAAVLYGINTTENTGCPVPELVEYDKNSIYLTYRYAGGGLQAEGGTLVGFEVKIGGKWVPVEAKIEEGNLVHIEGLSDKPQGVRYASELRYLTMEKATLISGTGYPACAFSVTF